MWIHGDPVAKASPCPLLMYLIGLPFLKELHLDIRMPKRLDIGGLEYLENLVLKNRYDQTSHDAPPPLHQVRRPIHSGPPRARPAQIGSCAGRADASMRMPDDDGGERYGTTQVHLSRPSPLSPPPRQVPVAQRLGQASILIQPFLAV